MSKEESALRSEREGKRAQFADEAGGAKKKNTVKILAVVALALAGLAAYFAAASGGRAAGVAGDGPLKADGGRVSIPASELNDKARFYEYKTASGKTVGFFAVRSTDGVYRAALNACDVCFAGKQGYRQEGEDMVCNQCGMHFPSSKVNEVKGGCNPVGLERKVEGDRVVIDARGLEAGARYF
jgi:uncharacterized membrane protein